MDTSHFYIDLGLNHVLDLNALDHIYFLIALATPFALKTIKELIIRVTFFTIGHSLALLLNNLYEIPVDYKWIEFLIPTTIALTCIPLILQSRSSNSVNNYRGLMSLLTIIFGVIHGFGFANYFYQIEKENLNLINLLEFAIGIELAQIIIVFIVILINLIFIKYLGFSSKKWQIIVGGIILTLSSTMVYDNLFFN